MLSQLVRALRRRLHPILQIARATVNRTVYALVARYRPLRPNSVILATNRGPVLTDNLRYIDKALDKTIYRIERHIITKRPFFARIAYEVRFIAAMAQAEYTLVDDFFPLVYPIRLRPGARLIQVWHALGAFKQVGYSRSGRHGGPPLTSISHRNYTDVIVSATSIRRDYAEAFGVDLEVVKATGIPRSDLFFDETRMARVRTRIRQELPFLRERRVILFAPTFRGRGRRSADYPIEDLDLAAFGAALGEQTILLIRMHPFVKRRPIIPEQWADRIFDLGDYPEFNHLLLVSDLLITDYSSAIFEYALLGRPVLFYAPDLDQYWRERGFYYPFSEYAYGPVVPDFPSLLAALDSAEYDEEQAKRFRERFLDRCDGQATKRFIETVFSPTDFPVGPAATKGAG